MDYQHRNQERDFPNPEPAPMGAGEGQKRGKERKMEQERTQISPPYQHLGAGEQTIFNRIRSINTVLNPDLTL